MGRPSISTGYARLLKGRGGKGRIGARAAPLPLPLPLCYDPRALRFSPKDRDAFLRTAVSVPVRAGGLPLISRGRRAEGVAGARAVCSPASCFTPGASRSSCSSFSPRSRSIFSSRGGFSRFARGRRRGQTLADARRLRQSRRSSSIINTPAFSRQFRRSARRARRCRGQHPEDRAADRRLLHRFRKDHLSRRCLSRRHGAGA